MQNAFDHTIQQTKKDMFEELAKKNMDTFNEITISMIDGVYQDRRKGTGIEKKELDKIVKQAQKKFDKDAYTNFKTLSDTYVAKLKDEINEQLGGSQAVAEYQALLGGFEAPVQNFIAPVQPAEALGFLQLQQ